MEALYVQSVLLMLTLVLFLGFWALFTSDGFDNLTPFVFFHPFQAPLPHGNMYNISIIIMVWAHARDGRPQTGMEPTRQDRTYLEERN